MSYKPQRKFLGSEGDCSVDDRGPEALKTDIDNIMNMFDPTATHPDGTQGGIDYGNLSFDISDEGMAEHIGGKLDGSALTVQQIIDLLNQMIKNRYTKEESDTLLTGKTNPLIKTLTYYPDTGVMTATTEAGNTVQVFDLNIEKIPADIGIVEEDNKVYIRITNTDGTYTQSDVSKLLTQYSFASTKTIQCQIAYMSGNNVDKTVSFILENGAVEMRHLAADVTSTITEAKESATISATSAATSASNAKDSEANAKVSEQNAKASEIAAEEAAEEAKEAAKNAAQEALKYVTVVDGLYYEDSMLYLTSNGEIASDPVEIVSGSGGSGGGGGGTSSVVRVTNNLDKTTFAVAEGGNAVLNFTFTSVEDEVPTGSGTCKITINGVVKTTYNIPQGVNTFDAGEYLSAGINNIKVTCIDVYGNQRSITYTITVIELKITSTFDDTVAYTGDITFKYTPYGLIEKTVHFKVDNVEVETVTTSTSGKQATKVFSAMTHGVHRLDVYTTAVLEDSSIESDHLIYDVMCVTSGETTSFIASPFTDTSATQGSQVSIPYTVYDPSKLACDIELNIYTMSSGSKVVYSTQNITVDRTRQYWNTRRYPVGTVYFEINYPTGNVSKTHTIEVTEATIDVEPTTTDMELSLLSIGRSNGEADPAVWSYDNISTIFTGFNWKSNGWIEDSQNDVALRLNGTAKATINFKPFEEDIRTYGKTIEIEFEIHDVNDRSAVVIDCMSNGIGIKATADRAVLQSEQQTIECRYKDDEKVRLTFVIESRNENRMMLIYLNGVLSAAKQYASNDNFQQSSPVNLVFGSEKCALDLYTIRSYSTALSTINATNNYIADIVDISKKIEVYENNDIYDEYSNLSYEKIKPKIPVMTIIGTLPTSKGNKQSVVIKYEDPVNPSLNFTDNCTIDVQGTSSQYYVRKNWKLKFPQMHQHAVGQLPAKVFCMKADYAEATGTHNTQNANIIHTLYSETIPPQATEEKIRTTVYGFPCVIFHQATENSDPTFYGKANFNYDKGAENVFGFTEDYEVECWEWLNNTSDVCNFKAPLPENWIDDFEGRYPDGNEDTTNLAAMLQWVYDTKDDLITFKNEFEQHFNLHYMLIYYVWTFVMLMVDQRAKNMMFTYWGSTQKWYPYFYDNDTCLGINNEGNLVFDYYHEDIDQLNGANVYNGQNSVLWNNFRQAYADEIAEIYRSLRSSDKLTYDKLCEYFIDNGSDKWSESIYNEDSDFKYISMLRSDNDATNLYQVRGDGEQHFKYFIKNRLDYCDSKWYAQDYADDYIALRIYTPSGTQAVTPNANITVTPFSNMYAGVRYKANGTLQQQRATAGTAVTFTAPSETFNDTETAIYGASNLSSLGDLSPLYAGSINVSKATKLTELIVGSSITGYSNPNLTDLSVGTNRLLKKIDIRNCSGLTQALNLSGCPNIAEIYAEGSAITSIDTVDGGFISILHLPSTIKNLTLKNQQYLISDGFTSEGWDELKTLWIEGCPNLDFRTVLEEAKSKNLERARLTDIDWSFDDISYLQSLYGISGIDETGANTDLIALVGKCHITSLTGAEMAEINSKYPYLTITYDNLTAQLVFMSEDGTTELTRQTINNGGNGTDPVTAGTISTPTKSSTAQYNYTFDGWSTVKGGSKNSSALNAVSSDRYVYAHFNSSIRYYSVYFYNETTLLQTSSVAYGGTATYTGSTPVKSDVDNPDDYPFNGWSPSPSGITGNTSCYAQFLSPLEDVEITDDWDTILTNINTGAYATKYKVGNYKDIDLGDEGTITMQIVAIDTDTFSTGHTIDTTWIAKDLLTTNHRITSYKDIWEECEMRSYLNDTILSLLPENIRKFIVPSPRTFHIISNDGITNDKLWIPSARELGVPSIESSGPVYSIVYSDDNSRIKRKWNSTDSSNYWTRSTASYSETNVLINIYGDKTIYKASNAEGIALGFCLSRNEIQDDWDTIIANIESDNTDSYEIGQYKEIDLSEQGKIIMQLVAKDADTLADGTGTAKTTWIALNIAGIRRMNPALDSTNYTEGTGSNGGWEKSEMRSYLNDTILSLIPENIRTAIKTVQKVSYTSKHSTTSFLQLDVITNDKLWIPSSREMGFSLGKMESSGPVYSVVFLDNNSRKKQSSYWTRTSAASSSEKFNTVYKTGISSSSYAESSSFNALVLGFCI